jgi:hypothetical protein
MGHQIGDRFPIPANHYPRTLPLNLGQKAGEPGLGFVDVDGLHLAKVSPVSPISSSVSCPRAFIEFVAKSTAARFSDITFSHGQG